VNADPTKRRAHPLKLLVIDDEPDVADVAGALLAAYGIANHVAYSAREGLLAIEQDTEINAVFSDIMMPGMNGLDLADMLLARYPTIHVVLTSGFTSPRILAEHERFYTFVPKPYRIEDVIALLGRKQVA
jgi:two-component system OmpR family response regulator